MDKVTYMFLTLMAKIRSIVSDIADIRKSSAAGAPTKVTKASEMTDTDKNYLYLGTESGYNSGHIYYFVEGVLTDGGAYGGVNVDDTLTISGQAADAKVTGDKIEEIKEDLSTKTGLSEEAKQALLACFANVAWVDVNGQDLYDALEDALYPPVTVVSISAVYTQSGTVYDTDSLDALKSDLVVTAHYSDGTREAVTSYTLSGKLTEGTSTITVSYGGLTTDFIVNVTKGSYTNPDSWLLNTAIYTDRFNQPYTDIQAPVNGVSILAKPAKLTSGRTYTVQTSASYPFYLMLCNDGIYKALVGRGVSTENTTQYTTIMFTADTENEMAISLKSPSTATAQDITDANVSVSDDQHLTWDLNKSIYINNTGQPFVDVQANYVGAMLLQSLIPVVPSSVYAPKVASGYTVRTVLIDSDGIYLRSFTDNGQVTSSDNASHVSFIVNRSDGQAVTSADILSCKLEIRIKPISA